jgi:hypothetical protein
MRSQHPDRAKLGDRTRENISNSGTAPGVLSQHGDVVMVRQVSGASENDIKPIWPDEPTRRYPATISVADLPRWRYVLICKRNNQIRA